METERSPYLLIFREVSTETYRSFSPEQRQQLLGRWNQWYEDLAAEGKVQHGHPLEPTGSIVTESPDERIIVRPFVESKECIGGYFLLTVADLNEAIGIAMRCPSLPLGMSVEVRPIAAMCPLLAAAARPAVSRQPAET
jgi:hypothetical protein